MAELPGSPPREAEGLGKKRWVPLSGSSLRALFRIPHCLSNPACVAVGGRDGVWGTLYPGADLGLAQTMCPEYWWVRQRMSQSLGAFSCSN